jgi:radical SAM superfamily enzyme YgiQ (UPF0313 family)
MAAAHLKRRRFPPFIIAGGPQVTESQNAAKLALSSGLFDVVAVGEGEETLLSIYRAFKSSSRTLSRPIPGTMYLNAETLEFTSSKRPLLKIKELPLPNFENMDLPAYEQRGNHLRVLPFQLSRGCTDKCSFCSEWRFWERFRSDDIEHVINQVEQLKAIYNIGGIAFTDSLLNGVMPRLRAFAEGLLEKNLDIKWGGFMRANMDSETASLLRRAGCVLGFFGIESLDDETLIEMNKRRTVADNINALEAFLNAGIAVRAGFIPGFPSDNRARFIKTAMIFRQLQNRFPDLLSTGIEPFVVAPGQPIYQNLKQYGLTPRKWAEEYLDIAPHYRTITENIYCTVEGANQGVERLGQYQIAITMSQDTLNRERTRQHTTSAQTSDFMHYSYNPDELESIFDLTIEHVFGNWYLGTFKTDSSLLSGFLLSHEERELYQEIRAHEQLTRPWASTTSLLERDSIGAFMDRIERRHIVISPRSLPRISWPIYRRAIQAADWLTLSSFVIAREWSNGGESEIILVNIINKRYLRTSKSFEPVLKLIIDSPRNLGEVLRSLGESSELQTSDQIVRLIEEMKELGILVICYQTNELGTYAHINGDQAVAKDLIDSPIG